MRLLLDTHALVWAATAPDQLGPRARELIEDPASTLLVSSASAWELSAKVRLGRFTRAEPLVAQYREIVAGLGAEHLCITHAHALRAGALAWSHRDPFDRMLAAQALLEYTPLITRDEVFATLGGVETAW